MNTGTQQLAKTINSQSVDKGLTRQALADKAGIAVETLYRLINGIIDKPSEALLSKVAGALDLPASALTNPDYAQVGVGFTEHYFTAEDGALGAYKNNGDRHQGDMPNSLSVTALPLLTFCVLVLENGQVVTGESFSADPESDDAEAARKAAYDSALQKIRNALIDINRRNL